jgi:hypothetical protein
MADELAKLSSPSWRDISFPLSSLEDTFDQDHVVHAWVYKDGVHIEATGRNAYCFHLSIPFCNGVQPASTELWGGQVLFPDVYRKFRAACIDHTSGPFVHPELGTITCKARNFRATFDPLLRDGLRVTVTLYESVDGDELNETITNLSALSTAQQSADRLDGLLTPSTVASMPELANDTDSFTDMMNAFAAGTAGLGRVRSKVDNLTLGLNRLNVVSNWQLVFANEDMRAALIDLNAQPASTNRTIKTFLVVRDVPLFSIGITLGISAADLVARNPKLARDPLVRAGTRLQYEAV